MTKAAQLTGGDQETEAPPHEVAHPGQGAKAAAEVQLNGTEDAALDPPTIEEQMVDPESATRVITVEEDKGLARSGVPQVEGTPTGSSTVEEVVQTDAAAEPLGERATGQGEHPEEDKED